MSYWNQSVTSDKYLDSSSWNWSQPSTESGNEKYWRRQLSSSFCSGSGSSIFPRSSSAPDNRRGYHPSITRSTVKHKSNQQVSSSEFASSDQGMSDVSRTSLSRADCKTIVLTNTPSSTLHLAATAGEKRKMEDRQPHHQNHKVAGMGGGILKRGHSSTAERLSKKQPQVGSNPVLGKPSGVCVDEMSRSRSTAEAKVETSSGSDQINDSRGVCPVSVVEQNKVKGRGRTAVGASDGQGGVGDASVGGGGGTDGVKGSSPDIVGACGSISSSVSSSNLLKAMKERPRPSDLKRPLGSEQVNAWETNGPSSLTCLLSVPKKRKTKTKKSSSVLLDSAKVMTSTFVVTRLPARKKDESTSSSTCAAKDGFHLLSPQGPGGILIHSPANSRSGANTTTLLSTREGIQKLGALGPGIMAGLSGVKVELPSTKTTAGDSAVTSGSVAMDIKRTNVSTLPDGIVGHVTSQVDHVTASMGTNGTSSFDPTTNNRVPELPDRGGLKNALTG